MGSETSKEEKEEGSILRQPQQGKASDLYWACRAGDLDSARELIASNPFTDLNRLEPNGSTALHAASYFGHTEIVRLLLHQHGVMRHRRNRHGFTAYEEAASDEIRQLFHRPANSHRFCSDNTDEAQHLFTSTGDEETEDDENDNDQLPNDWVQGICEVDDVRATQAYAYVSKKLSRSSILRKVFSELGSYVTGPDSERTESAVAKALQRLIDKHVTTSHSQYKKASELVSKYVTTKDVEYLLRLYSLNTPFYKNLGCDDKAECLLTPLYYKLDRLQKRAYQGHSFRGLTMTPKDLRAYRWALKHKGSILTTQSFCSTSVDENVARCFMGTSSSNNIPVLMDFNFVKKCDTALQLFRLSDTLPAISDFEDEREVLVLPLTLFQVTDIKIDKVTGQHTIDLENVPTKGGLFTLLRFAYEARNSKK
jgi:hypothetical protein